MVSGWIIPASGAAFTTMWTYHNGPFLGLPKLDRKYGIPSAVGLVILAWYLYKMEHMGHYPHLPPKIPRYKSYYASNPSIVSQKPLGAYTGPGLDDAINQVPESSIQPFPDNVARARTHGYD